MEEMMRELYQEHSGSPLTLSMIVFQTKSEDKLSSEYFDALFLIVQEDAEHPWRIHHYESGNWRAAVHTITKAMETEWLDYHRRIHTIDWFMNGEVIFDKNQGANNILHNISTMSAEEREVSAGREFARSIGYFEEAKGLFRSFQYLDAFHKIMEVLLHLARLSFIEHGLAPRSPVWEEIKKVNPDIFKLYTELIAGEDPLPERLDLLILALEYEIGAKTREGTAHLLTVMRERAGAWEADELRHRLPSTTTAELSLLLEYLVRKGIIDVKLEKAGGETLYHRKYTAGNFHFMEGAVSNGP
ncbi:nucleotidyltransferase-like protein [Alkalicoccus chagannorensis]|uniref:nucleotidyltransferase-like protein n=1 Tax=Alkalicoccus chagannorensis TaxID=427072 RepID=UPI00041C9BB0|nr:nucleotidyltransferase-like protein [Alkalicoccus chagannorensis]